VLAHVNYGGEFARRAEERDLIARYNPVLNVKHRTYGFGDLPWAPGGIGSLDGFGFFGS